MTTNRISANAPTTVMLAAVIAFAAAVYHVIVGVLLGLFQMPYGMTARGLSIAAAVLLLAPASRSWFRVR